jgi:acyl-CoA dehydrogenase
MDFTILSEVEALRARVAAFVDERILPHESRPESRDAHGNIAEAPLAALRAEARAAGLWAFQVPWRGRPALPFTALAALYEEMNRSIFGPVCFHAAAPEDGNMRLLQAVGTPEQKARWLDPLVEGRARSAFAMTEPAPGGGSDPTMIATRADRQGDRYVVTGAKWFITGAEGAAHLILIARTGDDPRRGLSAFVFDAGQPGWRIVRRIGIMGPEEHGGHCELAFDGLEIPAENLLLSEGQGLKVAQIRLGPARLTHCMRWLGLARRCLEIAQGYAATREGFGMRLADRESVRMALGEVAMGIEVGRLLVMKAAWALDRGGRARTEISMAKVHVAALLHQAADVAIQVNGARGYSTDTVLEWIYRYARQARLVDGADAVHRMVIADALAERGEGFWRREVE